MSSDAGHEENHVMRPPRSGTPSSDTTGAPEWQREAHRQGQHQVLGTENHRFLTQVPAPGLCELGTWKQVREGHAVAGPPPPPSPTEESSLLKAADTLRLHLPFQKPRGLHKYHFGPECSGGRVLWKFENSPRVTIFIQRTHSWPPLSG